MRNLKIGSSNQAPTTKRKTICVTATIILVAVLLLCLVLALTVFRPKQAIINVNSVKLVGLSAGFDIAHLGVDINATLLLNLSVTNPNNARFDYDNGTSELYYRGILVGEALIPAGEIGAGETIETVVKLTVLANRIVAEGSLYSDVVSGKLVMTTTTMVPGRVAIFGFLKHHMVMYSMCDVTIDVIDRMVTNSNCNSRTKF